MTLMSNTHNDGLEWLREVRRKVFVEFVGDGKRLGHRYRVASNADAGKVIDPRNTLTETIRAASDK